MLDLLADKQYLHWVEQKVKAQQESLTGPATKFKGKELLVSKITQENVFREILSVLFSFTYELICMRG